MGDTMTTLLEERTQFRQIGNSLGIIVPVSIRKGAGFCSGDEVTLECPRPGVITISNNVRKEKNKVQAWDELQAFISAHRVSETTWPQDKSFKDVLNEARDERYEW